MAHCGLLGTAKLVRASGLPVSAASDAPPPWPRARARQDKERYFVLWPEAAPLAALGEHVVLDPYSGGAPAMLSEVRT